MELNNFKRLQQEDEQRYKPAIDRIKADLNGSMDLYRFIGQIVEVYVPRFIDMVVMTSGGQGRVRTNTPHDHTPLSPDRGEGRSGGPGELDPGRR